MPESIRFASAEEQKEQLTKERLKLEGGIFYDTKVDPETTEKKSVVNIMGVEVESHASAEDIEEIKESLILSETDQKLLRRIAEAYNLKQAFLVESDPGAGKTFLYKQFIQMVHGKDAPVLELVGSPRTSELEILGHWAPKGLSEEETKAYEAQMETLMSSSDMQKESSTFQEQLSELNQKLQAHGISEEEFRDEFGRLSTAHVEEQRKKVTSFFESSKLLKPDTQWEFKQGALLRAYSGNGGKGYPLIVDEFNLIPSNYQQIFLQIGGHGGGLSDSVSFWGNSGKTTYERGEDTWVCFASNFPEKTQGRSEIVAPMSDRLIWYAMPNEEYQAKRKAIKRTAGGRLARRRKELFTTDAKSISVPVENGMQWDKVMNEQIGEQIADIVDVLDEEFVKSYEALGDSVTIGNDKRKRTQRMEFSGRNPLRLFHYLDHFQVRDAETGRIDFTQTLRNAFELYYVGRIADEKLREKARKLFDELMTGDTGKVEVPRDDLTFKEKITEVAEKGAVKKKMKTRKELLDGLTKILEEGEQKRKEVTAEQIMISEPNLFADIYSALQAKIKSNKKPGELKDIVNEFFEVKNVSENGQRILSRLQSIFSEILQEKGDSVVVDVNTIKGGIDKGQIDKIKRIDGLKIQEPIIAITEVSTPLLKRELESSGFGTHDNRKILHLVDKKELLSLVNEEAELPLVERIKLILSESFENKLARLVYESYVKSIAKGGPVKIEFPNFKDEKKKLTILAKDGPVKKALEVVIKTVGADEIPNEDERFILIDCLEDDISSWSFDEEADPWDMEIFSGEKVERLKRLAQSNISANILLYFSKSKEQILKAHPDIEKVFEAENIRPVWSLSLADIIQAISDLSAKRSHKSGSVS